jgi:large repetitive protein
VMITITPVSDAPVAVNDAVSTNEDTAVSGNVLVNDTDSDASPSLTAILVAGPDNLTLNADGSFTYTPTANFNGTASFTYKANDGTTDSNVATVTITIDSVNDAPVASDDAASTTDVIAVTIAVLANDGDLDGDSLAVSIASPPPPAQGAAVINGDGTITYTPAADYGGSHSFNYTIDDGHGGTATATVSVTVTAANDGRL